MFLISKSAYDAMVRSTEQAKEPYLKIINHEPNNHKQTFYKFRYFAPDDGKTVEPTEASVEIKSGSFQSVWSFEAFVLSEKVMAIFGHPSELFGRGLELIHSPFVEPKFYGRLQFVIRNFSDQDITLNPGDNIGKIVFLDISDSEINLEELVKESQENEQNLIRQKAAQVKIKN